MNKSNYQYQLEERLIIVENRQSTHSVYLHLEEVLANIEAETGSKENVLILYECLDGFWDLIIGTQIYPLNAPNLTDAKARLGRLVASGRIF